MGAAGNENAQHGMGPAEDGAGLAQRRVGALTSEGNAQHGMGAAKNDHVQTGDGCIEGDGRIQGQTLKKGREQRFELRRV